MKHTADAGRHVYVSTQVADVEREPVVDESVDKPIEVNVERLLPHVRRFEQAEQIRMVLLLFYLFYHSFQLLFCFLNG